MARNFPHLQDTDFPYLAGENAYAYKNEFDYTRWSDNVTIKLCNLNVDENNRCVLDDSAKDLIFSNETPGCTFHAASHIVQNVCKLPLPFETCAKYNYLAIRYPVATSPDKPIDYADAAATKDFFWLIEDVTYISPNTTSLTLRMDVWATYAANAHVSYMKLARGHAPMTVASVEDYLSNPITHYDSLSGYEGFEIANPIVRKHDFVDYGNSEKYIVFAVSMDADFIPQMKAAPQLNGSSAATFANRNISYAGGLDSRTANYYTVNDYDWGYTVRNYNDCLTNTGVPKIVDNIYSALSFVAVSTRNAFAEGFLSKMISEYPYFLKTVEFIAIASAEMLSFGKKLNLCGYDAYIVQGSEQVIYAFDLSKDDFGYPTEYENVTKLYTTPYSLIRVTNGESSIDINVQDVCNDSAARAKCILSTLDYVTMFDNIGGNSSDFMDVVKLDGSTIEQAIPNGNWQDYILTQSIPTYAIYLSNMHSAAIDNYTNDMTVNRNAAIADYHAANRSDNCAWHNTQDEADTSIANCATQTATNTAITNHGNDFLENSKDANVSKLKSDHSVDVIATSISVAASAVTDLMSYVTNQSAGASSAAIGFVGDLVGLRWGQAVSGAANWGVSAAQAAASYNITHSKDAALNAAAAAQANGKTNNATTLISNVTSYQKSTATNVTSAANSGLTTQNTRSNGTIKDNARYSFEDAHAAEANALSIAQQRIYAKYRDLKRSGNTAITADGGYKDLDAFNMRGLDFQIVTLNDGDLHRIGDAMLRYGYAYNRNWNFTSWNMMQNFTYWQCSDVWFNKSDIPEFAIREMKADLQNGITVWRNVADMMHCSIYENGI